MLLGMTMDDFTAVIKVANEVIAKVCHMLALFVITVGVAKAMAIYLRDIFSSHKSKQAIQESRLEMGHSFSLALAFLIGASILRTTFAPTWNDLGQLATIIAIRTALNYFLLRDVKFLAQQQPEGVAPDQAAAKKPKPEPDD
jgi:uncharacterized membrane protein